MLDYLDNMNCLIEFTFAEIFFFKLSLDFGGFRELKTLDDFDWSFKLSTGRRQTFDLAAGRFKREAHDVLMYGPPGVGMSFLAQACGYQAVKAGLLVKYRSIFDLIRDFLHD
ncbi:MAG: ATP-binding protein [Gemmataceae bacterium]